MFKFREICDVFIKGKCSNEKLKNFLEHIFENKIDLLPEVLETPYFTSKVNSLQMEKLFPLKYLPRTFKNKQNTYWKGEDFQINLTLTDPNAKEDIENFLKTFAQLSDLPILAMLTNEEYKISFYVLQNGEVYKIAHKKKLLDPYLKNLAKDIKYSPNF